MFNTTNISSKQSVNNEITFNSVAGTLVRSAEKSKFTMVHGKSGVFGDEPGIYCRRDGRDVFISIAVLQVMLCGNDNMLIEYIEV